MNTTTSNTAFASIPKPLLHQYRVSPFAAKVRRCLHYKGIDFEVADYGLAGIRKIKKMNPRSKAPILEHQGRFIPDSTDIVRYLDTTYPEKPVIPSGQTESALAHILEDWADESLYFYDLTVRSWPNNSDLLADDLVMSDKGLAKRLFHHLVPAIISRQARSQGTGRKERDAVCEDINQHFQAIDRLASQPGWLAGAELSIADIAVASMCTVLERAQEAKASMERYPALMEWRMRVDAATLPDNTPQDLKAMV